MKSFVLGVFFLSLIFSQNSSLEKTQQLRFELMKKRMDIIREDPRLWFLLQQIIGLNKQILDTVKKNPDFQKIKQQLEQLEKN